MKVKKIASLSELRTAIESDLKKAAKTTLSRVAYTARQNAVQNVQNSFTLRNSFTLKSIKYEPCKGGAALSDFSSTVGILDRAEYMARQEKGGAHTAKSGANLAIPTTFARGGSNAKSVKKTMRLDQILPRVAKTSRKGSRKAALVARAAIAGASKSSTPFIRLNNGIFKVSNFRRLKSGQIKFKTRLVYNFKFKETQTAPAPWLRPAAEDAARLMQQFFNEEMDKA